MSFVNKSGKSKNLLSEPISFNQIQVGDVITVEVCGKNAGRATYDKLATQPTIRNLMKNKTYNALFLNRKSKESSSKCVRQVVKLVTVTKKMASANQMNPSVIIGRTGSRLFGSDHLFISDRDGFYKFDNITDKASGLLGLANKIPGDAVKNVLSYVGGKTAKKHHGKRRRVNKATRSKKMTRSRKSKRSKKM